MAHELTITEIRFIRSLLAIKTDAQIAGWLEKPISLIRVELDNEYCDLNEYYSLRLSDKIEISRVLEEHILLRNYTHL